MALPYGTWPSVLSAEAVSRSSPRLAGARFVNARVWWAQSVPAENGRTAIYRTDDNGERHCVLPAPWSARSRVHGYGGGEWDVTSDGALIFVEARDQRVWRWDLDAAEPSPLTPPDAGMRFGSLHVRGTVLVCVREQTDTEGRGHRDLTIVPLDGAAANDANALASVVSDADFVAQPALSPDAQHLAWVQWSHPHMPWDRTEIHIARLEGTHATDRRVVSAGASALQPEWRGTDEVLFVDDRSGWWNLMSWHASGQARPLAPAEADTGGPLWSLGARWYAPTPAGIVCVRTRGIDQIFCVTDVGAAPVAVPVVADAAVHAAEGARVLVSGTDAHGRTGLWIVDADTFDVESVWTSAAPWGSEWMPEAREVSIDTPRGPVHSFAFAPTNPMVSGPPNEAPPYVVLVHGGPTGQAGAAPSAKTAYFTSRGIGVLAVNYAGSTGYGRAYRERLRGQWGVADVEDVASAASALAAAGIADGARLAIDGGSAGGWTVLAALARTDVFSAGVSRYGVGDATALAQETHDFEARYLDGLIGPLPEALDLYKERSPLTHASGFDAPMLLLQGSDDEIVPPTQAEAIREALTSHGIPHASVLYEGEGHGFRRSETIVHALETELAFLGATFGFTPADVAPLTLGTGEDAVLSLT